ncbi:MAG TPA: GGDEF domain-containing protein [Polyangiaceae bacterium]|nr:GGDEF domain-containing protein [Polyangiaceae bacterium]
MGSRGIDQATFEDEPPTQVAVFTPDAHYPETERALTVPLAERDPRATLTVISGEGAGRGIALTQRRTLIGRSPAADLRLEDAAISRSHAHVIVKEDGYVLEDLGSTNGTFLRGVRVLHTPLAAGDRFQLGPKVVVRLAVADQLERELLTRLVESSTRDALTGAYNRRFFDQRLEAELGFARRHGTKVAVLVLDLDQFKLINDAHGHEAGDHVLRAVADAVSRALRIEDLVARYGGDEFVILARAVTHLDAFRLAERVRAAMASLEIALASGERVAIMASIGVARNTECPAPCTAAAIMKLADTRVYRAKASGRNSICATG